METKSSQGRKIGLTFSVIVVTAIIAIVATIFLNQNKKAEQIQVIQNEENPTPPVDVSMEGGIIPLTTNEVTVEPAQTEEGI